MNMEIDSYITNNVILSPLLGNYGKKRISMLWKSRLPDVCRKKEKMW